MLDFDIDQRNAKCRHQTQVPVDLQTWPRFLGQHKYYWRVENATRASPQNSRVNNDEQYEYEMVIFVVPDNIVVDLRFSVTSLE